MIGTERNDATHNARLLESRYTQRLGATLKSETGAARGSHRCSPRNWLWQNFSRSFVPSSKPSRSKWNNRLSFPSLSIIMYFTYFPLSTDNVCLSRFCCLARSRSRRILCCIVVEGHSGSNVYVAQTLSDSQRRLTVVLYTSTALYTQLAPDALSGQEVRPILDQRGSRCGTVLVEHGPESVRLSYL
ncbi:hypothetical protein C8R43DRAFT_1041678, partial [Mycena crocata]